MDDLPTHIGNKERSADRQGLMSKRTPLAAVHEPENIDDPDSRTVTPTAMKMPTRMQRATNVRCPRLCRRRLIDAGCGESLLDEMEKGLEQNEPDKKIERQEESGRNGKALSDGAMELARTQNTKNTALRSMSQCPRQSRFETCPPGRSIMLLNQEATGCRDLQAAQRNKLKTRKLVRTCQAEIASGGVLMAIRMRKTILSA